MYRFIEYFRASLLYVALFLLTFTAFGQKLKNKDVKRVLDEGKVTEVNIICEDQFTPERRQEMDLKVTFQDGTTALASDYPVIWEKSDCEVLRAGMRIKGELLENGKCVIVPNLLYEYYPGTPEASIAINVDLAGKKTTKVLTPNYCFENYNFVYQGNKGRDGTRGMAGSLGGNGSRGDHGTNGSDGPAITVQIEEEIISSKVFMIVIINEKKFAFDPTCSTVHIISRGGPGGDGGRGGEGGDSRKADNKYTDSGGRGGNGGEGGSGGNGGVITVSGGAAEKYKSRFTFLSDGGKRGDGGYAGYGGAGKSKGTNGSTGRDGYQGKAGQVIFQNVTN